jgi:O-antigen/teichoic acid export membrane protein
MTRSRRFIWNYFSASANQATVVLVAIVTAPLLLRWLGQERYGAFRVTLDWLGYLALLELGLGGALPPLFAKAVGQTDILAIRRTMSAGIRAYIGVGLFGSILWMGLTLINTKMVPIDARFSSDLQVGWIIVAVTRLLTSPLAPFRPLMESCQKNYWIDGFVILQSLCVMTTSVLFAWMGWGITGQCLGLGLGSVLFYLAIAWKASRDFPGILTQALQVKPNAETWQAIRSLNRPTFIRQMCFQVGVLSDGILVALVLGPEMVVPLVMTQRLCALALTQLRAIAGASWAGLVELQTKNRSELFNQRLIELTSLLTILAVGSLVPIVSYNRHFVTRWVGEQYYVSDWLTIIAAGNAYLLALTMLWNWCMVGTGQVRELVTVSVYSTVINLAISLLLIRPLGVVGPVLGTFLAFLSTHLWYLPILLGRHFGTSGALLVKSIAVPLGWGLPYGGAIWWISRSHVPWGWFGLLAEMAIAALAYWVIAWKAIFNDSQRANFLARARNAIPRRLAA